MNFINILSRFKDGNMKKGVILKCLLHITGELMFWLMCCFVWCCQELEYHKKEVEELEEGNQQLQRQVKQLLHDPKTNVRLQMFPEFFPDRPK